MRLAKVRVREFKSVQDSGEFTVGDVTCLVGKNESGKTALLEALYRLNPIVEADAKFDVTEDYPRNEVEDYLQDIEAGKRNEHRYAVTAVFTLGADEVSAVTADFGDGVLTAHEIELSRGYDATFYVTVPVDEAIAVKTLAKKAGLRNEVATEANKQKTLKALEAFLAADADRRQKQFAEAQKAATAIADAAQKAAAVDGAQEL